MRLDEITRRGFLKGASAAAMYITIGSAVVLPTPANAASNWYHAATSNIDKWKFFVDLDSIEVLDDGVYEFWCKTTDTGSKNKFPGTHDPIRLRININDSTAGEYVGNNITMQKIAPDSVADLYRDIFVKWKRDKSRLVNFTSSVRR